MIDERYFLSLSSQGARAVLRRHDRLVKKADGLDRQSPQAADEGDAPKRWRELRVIRGSCHR